MRRRQSSGSRTEAQTLRTLALLAFYSVLLVIEMYLMIKFARLGPSSLHTGRYHFEKIAV